MDLVLRRVLERVMGHVDADGALLFVVDGDSASSTAGCGMLAGHERIRDLADGGMTGRVVATAAPVRVGSLAEMPGPSRLEAQKLGIASVLLIPVFDASRRVVAVVGLASKREHAFSSREDGVLGGLIAALGAILVDQSDADRRILRRQLEVAESEHRFRAFMRAAPMPAWIKDQAGRFTFVNEQLERVWNITSAEVIGQTDAYFLPADVAEAVRQNDLLVLAEGKTIRVEEAVPTPDGSVRHWLSTKFPIQAQDGHVHVGGMAVDITEQKHAEEVQRRQREHLQQASSELRAMLDALAEGVIINQGGAVVYANQRAATLFGFANVEAFLGTRIRSMLDEVERSSLDQDMRATLAGATIRALRRAHRRDGRPFTLESSASRIEYEGEPGLAVVLRDVTEQREAEARQALTRRLASVGTLGAAVAHEINNPLTLVLTNLRLVSDELVEIAGATPPSRMRELIANVSEASSAAERIRSTVRVMRGLVDRGERDHETSPVSAIVATAVQTCRVELGDDITVTLSLDPTPRATSGYGDLLQVLQVLIANATDAIRARPPRGGEIQVATRTSERGELVLEVADDGIGITPEALPHIFDPFFTTKQVGAGTGLGLAVAHHVVAKHGGTIEVEPASGGGTLFRVRLPGAESSIGGAVSAGIEAPRPMATPAKPDIAGARVLVVDDEPSLGLILARVLGRVHGASVVVATSGNEALCILEQGGVDVVLTDIMMPSMNGLELHGEIADRFPELANRVVFMTGGILSQAHHVQLAALPNTCLEKPLDAQVLVDALANVRRARGVGADDAPPRDGRVGGRLR